jgi:outer membrane protein TolC
MSGDGSTWSLGPLQLTLPLFDGGTRRANRDAARAEYDAAVVQYQGRLRRALREVEQALVTLDSTATRSDDARIAAEGFESALRATESRHRGGLASQFELEDARRNTSAAQRALILLQQERAIAWVDLARALGGGWLPGEPTMATRP